MGRYMRIGLGVLRLAPCHFWSMTPVEFRAALEGWRDTRGEYANAVPPPRREELEEMMARFPDQRPDDNPA